MKRFLLLLLSVLFIFTVGCAPQISTPPPNDNPPPAENPPVTLYDFSAEKCTVSGFTVSKNTDSRYLYDDEDNWSIHLKRTGNWISVKFNGTNEIGWADIYSLEFYAYNPSIEYDFVFRTVLYDEQNNGEKFGTPKTALADEWTKITIYSSELLAIFNSGKKILTLSANYTENGNNASSNEWKDFELYLDGFKFTLKD